MDATELDRVYEAFLAFHARFAPYFGRREATERSEQYVRGLLVQRSERRSAENLAEAVPGATPRALQRFLTESPWPVEPVTAGLQAYVGERLSDGAGVFIPDETGFAKQGKKSVGVQRQYSGTLGKTGNCQVGVFLTYAAPTGHATVDARLYMPERWTKDPARCRSAGVPEEEIRFCTKPELALEMIRAARERGHLAGQWVTADEVYGNSPTFRDGACGLGILYVLEVESTLPVFEEESETVLPAWSGQGRPPKKRRLAPGARPAREVRAIRQDVAPEVWRVLTAAEGSQGPRRYRFAALRVWESRGGLPDRAAWLLFRENLDGSEPRSFLSNAPEDTPLQRLAEVASARWAVEEDFQTLKGECGLDEYEVRSWSGWHHHVTLALLAGAFLLELERSWGKNQPRAHASPGGPHPLRAAAAQAVDERRPARLAGNDPGEERVRPVRTHETTPTRRATHAA